MANEGWHTWVVSRTSSSDRPGIDQLSPLEVAGRQRGVDDDVVPPLGQLLPDTVAQAKAPGRRVVRGAVRHEVGAVREGVQMRLELVEGQLGVDGDAVAHDVQVAGLEVDDAVAAAGRRDVRVADLPLVGDRPVEHTRTRTPHGGG